MKNKWEKIFNNKNFFYYSLSKKLNLKKKPLELSYMLASIIYPNLTNRKFINIINFIKFNLRIKKKSSILDFGSGNGAFIFFFIKKLFLINNLSLEISHPLLKFQKTFISKTKFVKTHHIKTDYLNRFKDKAFDYSYCNSVFQYFTSDKYAKIVIDFLIRTTRKNILIYDIKNYHKQNVYKEMVRKRQGLTKKDFKKKYCNTPIKFYKKDFFIKTLNTLKKKYSFNYKFKNLPYGATDSKFGYCLIIYKK